MNLALGVCPSDIDTARDLLSWMAELDGVQSNHRLLIIGGAKLTPESVTALAEHARLAFTTVQAIKLRDEPDKAWPNACNVMFKTSAEWIRINWPGYFLWLEPDTIPIVPHWLDQLEAEYLKVGKPFMGTAYENPWRHINGVAIYPQHIVKFNPAILGATDRPWDLTNHGATLKHAHNSPLMQRSIADPAKNLAHTFPDAASMAKILRPGAILFHGCRDGSLTNLLRAQRGDVSAGGAVRKRSIPQQLSRITTHASSAIRKVKDAIRGTPAFYHSGNLGDLIYSLYAIQLSLPVGAQADLIIGPEQKNTAACSNPINQPQFNLLLPLLKTQPYLRRITWQPHHPGTGVTHDLNQFRNLWRDPGLRARTNIQTLCQMHCHLLGVANRFDPEFPWLASGLAGQAIYTGKIIVARSPRYQNPTFPWATLVDKYADRMLFIGLPDEYRAFLAWIRADSNTQISYYQARDLFEMARVIAGGCAFIGNQSMPCALAIGLGQRLLQETDPKSPDCLFNRPSLVSI